MPPQLATPPSPGRPRHAPGNLRPHRRSKAELRLLRPYRTTPGRRRPGRGAFDIRHSTFDIRSSALDNIGPPDRPRAELP